MTDVRPRVVSLVPSATETLLAAGADVVACTRFCEQPSLPTVGGTKNPDVAAIVALAPDVVVLDVEENRREDADELAAAGLDLLVTDVRSLAGAVEAVARLAPFGPRGDRLSVSVAEAVAAATNPDDEVTRTAFVPIWRRPWMALGPGTYGADLLAHLGLSVRPDSGLDPDRTSAAERYPSVEPDSIEPVDLVLVPSEPYEFRDEHVAELAAAQASAALLQIDGQDLFWWGARTPAAIDRLRAALAR